MEWWVDGMVVDGMVGGLSGVWIGLVLSPSHRCKPVWRNDF